MPQSLISNEEKQQNLNEELLQATRNKKDLSIIEEIIIRGANVNYANKDGWTPLHFACEKGHTELAIALIEKGANVNYANKDGWTPLHYACHNGHTELAIALIEKGANVNCVKKDGWTPLHSACEKGHTELAIALIERGANVNCVIPKWDNKGKTPLHSACYYGHTATAIALIERRADVNCADEEGRTPLYSACVKGHTATALALIKRGADVNCTTKYGETPLLCACGSELTGVALALVALALIDKGADVNCVNKDGWTPLHYACSNRLTEVALALIERGADVNCVINDGCTPLHSACYKGITAIALALIERDADVNCVEKNGLNPLHYACHNGHTEIAIALIERGAVVNCVEKNGLNPLHFACHNGHTSTALALIERGADVNCAITGGDYAGQTPIQMAVIRNKAEAINLLFELGADVACLNQEFIEKYKTKINQETKDLIAKITQEENIKKRDEDLERKKNAKLSEETQQEKKGDLVSAEVQKKLSALESKVEEIQKKLIGDSKQQVDGLKLAIDQQLALASNESVNVGFGAGGDSGAGVGFKATLSDNINPRFLVSPQDLQEIKYIQNNPELNEYYMRMQKCFNEAFLFAMIVSQGGTAIEEQSRIVNSLENISNLVGDIPFASLIVNQFKYGASAISKAKIKGQQANFSDMVFTSDPIESSLLAERIARRFTISRELNEQAGNQIIANASEIKDKGRIEKMKIYLKDQAGKLAKYLGVDKNLEKGFLGEDLSITNQLALSDFAKAVEFIFNEGISPEIKGNIDETNRHQEIAKEIVSKAIELEVKDFKRDYQTARDNRLTQPTQRENSPIVATTSTSEIEVSIENLGPTANEMMAKFAEMQSEIATLRRRVEERENTIGEMQTNQEKLKKLTEFAELVPNLEITIGQGPQAKTMKLGDIMKDQKNKNNNLEQNLGPILSQIQLQFESQGQRLEQIEGGRPASRVREVKSNCCLPQNCAVM